jgi:hypothetical protein
VVRHLSAVQGGETVDLLCRELMGFTGTGDLLHSWDMTTAVHLVECGTSSWLPGC